MKKFLNSLVFVFMGFSILLLLTGCTTNSDEQNEKTVYKPGETFVFDNFELSIGSDVTFETIKNEFSEHNGKEVIKVPVNVKNIGEDSRNLNMFYYKCYGSQGIELDDAASFFDDSLDYAASLKNGASYTRYVYYLYDGDGEYSIEFNEGWGTKLEVKFNVAK